MCYGSKAMLFFVAGQITLFGLSLRRSVQLPFFAVPNLIWLTVNNSISDDTIEGIAGALSPIFLQENDLVHVSPIT
jgi:hypothetical protein